MILSAETTNQLRMNLSNQGNPEIKTSPVEKHRDISNLVDGVAAQNMTVKYSLLKLFFAANAKRKDIFIMFVAVLLSRQRKYMRLKRMKDMKREMMSYSLEKS